MSIGMMIYLADVAGSIKNVFDGATVFAMVAVCLSFFCLGPLGDTLDDKATAHCWRAIKMSIVVCVLASTIAAVIPSKNTIYAIAATHYAQEIAGKPSVQILGDKVYQVLNQKLDEIIDNKTKEK